MTSLPVAWLIERQLITPPCVSKLLLTLLPSASTLVDQQNNSPQSEIHGAIHQSAIKPAFRTAELRSHLMRRTAWLHSCTRRCWYCLDATMMVCVFGCILERHWMTPLCLTFWWSHCSYLAPVSFFVLQLNKPFLSMRLKPLKARSLNMMCRGTGQGHRFVASILAT